MIAFDGLSTPGTSAYNATELRIPSSIKKYELLTFDIPKMREILARNETITIRINGVPYEMKLHDTTGKAIGLDPSVRSYRGIFEKIKNSEVSFTISKQVITGEISIDHMYYSISSTPKRENGKVLQYIYSSLDDIREGPPTYWADDYLAHRNATVRTSASPATQLPATTQTASLTVIITLCALFFIGLKKLVGR